jgi:UDP-N-acetylmuramoyl-tripeptide--D-alanyl-D-alanine ligase
MTTQFYIYAASLALICFYAAVKLRYELQMLQQNSYRTDRYWHWFKQQYPTGKLSVDCVTSVLMAGILGSFAFSDMRAYAFAAVALACFYKGVKLLTVKYKKPLVFTARAMRLYIAALAITALVVVPLVLCGLQWWSVTVAFFLATCAPLVMMLSVWLLSPVEKAINGWYVNDARRILSGMPHLIIIGITGSYGKTSTKHYLYRILSERFSVVMTPGSFNTTLGVVRTVREHLKPFHEVFIVEMGAKQPGDIAEIGELVHPSIGIITAVGEQHLESFKTIENVQKTKFELIDALPPDGVAILNDDFEYIAARPVTNVRNVFRYTSGQPFNDDRKQVGEASVSAKNEEKSEYHTRQGGMELAPNGSAIPPVQPTKTMNAGYRIADVKYGRNETSFTIENPDGVKTAPLTTKLAGIHNLSNILAGYIAGRVLGMTESEMRYAIGGIEQVEHRLNIKHTPGGITIIDDAFNSNPHGAAMALDVLAGFTEGQRIVVTPGMIELGVKQQQYNREFGRQMAQACDVAIVVGEYNREAILEGLAEKNFPAENSYTARDFADASQHVRAIVKPGDTVLYENDLPDTFK